MLTWMDRAEFVRKLEAITSKELAFLNTRQEANYWGISILSPKSYIEKWVCQARLDE